MQRVVILGRGASGKSTFAHILGEITNLPVIELDQHFWQESLTPTPREDWVAIQERLIRREEWIMDGDLGPYDIVDRRLQAADTIILLDFSLMRCAWRAVRRSRERADFWLWLITYRRRSLPALRTAISTHGANTTVHVFRHPRQVNDFITHAGTRPPG